MSSYEVQQRIVDPQEGEIAKIFTKEELEEVQGLSMSNIDESGYLNKIGVGIPERATSLLSVDDVSKGENIDLEEIYLKEIKRSEYNLIEDEMKVRELVVEAQRGNEEVRNELVKRNLRMVVGIARRHMHDKGFFHDLIQIGNLALIKATQKFDLTKEVKFSTYAYAVIRNAVIRFTVGEKYGVVKTYYDTMEIRRFIDDYEKEHEIKPSEETIREYLGKKGISEKEIMGLLKRLGKLINMNREKFLLLNEEDPPNKSFGKIQIDRTLKRSSRFKPEEMVIEEDLINSTMNKSDLTEIERKAFRMSLDGYTQEQIARALGYNGRYRNRTVSNTIARATKKIRNKTTQKDFY